jgi:regulator of sirC expression with transglutaminase-like and TPR domain
VLVILSAKHFKTMSVNDSPENDLAKRLLAEINQAETAIDLGRAALVVAQTAYPDLDIDVQLRLLDHMAAEVASRLPAARYPLRIIQTINDYLFEELGFRGNTQNYYDPRNSFLNDVLSRRTGIPITLAVVYLEIARRIDFPMIGIGMPGHFIVQPDFEESDIFVDAFNGGEILFAEDCRQKLRQIYQQEIPVLSPELLPPVTKKQILARMLNNLRGIYLDQRDMGRALVVQDLLEALL